MTEEQLRAELAAAGADLAAADAARDAAIARVRAAVRAADGAIPVSHMADLAGVTRPTIYKMLGDS